jgi:hypothetical protein
MLLFHNENSHVTTQKQENVPNFCFWKATSYDLFQPVMFCHLWGKIIKLSINH